MCRGDLPIIRGGYGLDARPPNKTRPFGILSAGGHFSHDMAGAAYAASDFDFKTVIPCHYAPLTAPRANRLGMLVDCFAGVGRDSSPKCSRPSRY